jgi:type III pantothenate kinase
VKLIIDSGNTSLKAAIFNGKELLKRFNNQEYIDLYKLCQDYTFNSAIISTVKKNEEEIKEAIHSIPKIFFLNKDTVLPISNLYASPETLGPDRLAGVVAASIINPGQNTLVIDAGTCITYDFLEQGKNYLGGAISPGLKMRLQALHTFTGKLPLVELKSPVELIGNNTETSILSGVLNGLIAEIKGVIEEYRKNYGQIKLIMTGGEVSYFETSLKEPIFAVPELLFIGLNRILDHNEGN